MEYVILFVAGIGFGGSWYCLKEARLLTKDVDAHLARADAILEEAKALARKCGAS